MMNVGAIAGLYAAPVETYSAQTEPGTTTPPRATLERTGTSRDGLGSAAKAARKRSWTCFVR